MITYKTWSSRTRDGYYTVRREWEGWFLFGLFPLYIRQINESRWFLG